MDQCKNCPQEGKRWKCVGEFEANYKKGEVREDIIHVLKLLLRLPISKMGFAP